MRAGTQADRGAQARRRLPLAGAAPPAANMPHTLGSLIPSEQLITDAHGAQTRANISHRGQLNLCVKSPCAADHDVSKKASLSPLREVWRRGTLSRMASLTNRKNSLSDIQDLLLIALQVAQKDRVKNGELYRYIADNHGIFVQPAKYEAFGLTVSDLPS